MSTPFRAAGAIEFAAPTQPTPWLRYLAIGVSAAHMFATIGALSGAAWHAVLVAAGLTLLIDLMIARLIGPVIAGGAHWIVTSTLAVALLLTVGLNAVYLLSHAVGWLQQLVACGLALFVPAAIIADAVLAASGERSGIVRNAERTVADAIARAERAERDAEQQRASRTLTEQAASLAERELLTSRTQTEQDRTARTLAEHQAERERTARAAAEQRAEQIERELQDVRTAFATAEQSGAAVNGTSYTFAELADAFGVAKSTASEKLRRVREAR